MQSRQAALHKFGVIMRRYFLSMKGKKKRKDQNDYKNYSRIKGEGFGVAKPLSKAFFLFPDSKL
jgi:hypothetical protein